MLHPQKCCLTSLLRPSAHGLRPKFHGKIATRSIYPQSATRSVSYGMVVGARIGSWPAIRVGDHERTRFKNDPNFAC